MYMNAASAMKAVLISLTASRNSAKTSGLPPQRTHCCVRQPADVPALQCA